MSDFKILKPHLPTQVVNIALRNPTPLPYF
jgi:hypothetical protein